MDFLMISWMFPFYLSVVLKVCRSLILRVDRKERRQSGAEEEARNGGLIHNLIIRPVTCHYVVQCLLCTYYNLNIPPGRNIQATASTLAALTHVFIPIFARLVQCTLVTYLSN